MGGRGMIRVIVSQDGMTAVLADAEIDAGALEIEHLMDALAEAGVVEGIDHDGITQAIILNSEGKSFEGTVIARGIAPREPEDATLKPNGRLSFPFFRGDVIGTLTAPGEPSVGTTVTGLQLPPRRISSPKQLSVAPESGVAQDENGSLTAEYYGVLRVEDGSVSLRPLIDVSDDRFKVMATVYSKDALNREITPERIAALILPMKITAQVNRQAVSDALREAEKSKTPQRVAICEGKLPVHGSDATFESPVSTGLSAGVVMEDGSVDYSERGIVRSVEEGDFLGRITTQSSGIPGRDVYGNLIPARDGAPLAIKVGENVHVSEDGLEFFAAISGMLVLNETLIAVSEICEIAGDVSFSTGNVRMDKGSVFIHGSIREGFVVESAGNIVVDGSIEGARVRAGGDIEVRGGITMKDKGLVQAGGSIKATFAANAVLQAKGDIIITNEIINSKLASSGRVLASGSKGKILGGDVHSTMGVEAKEIGSHMGVVSHVSVGCDLERNKELQKEKKNLLSMLDKIRKVVGDKLPKEVLANTPETKKEVMIKLLQTRDRVQAKLAELEYAISVDDENICRRMNARIRVSKAIHAGSSITLYGRGLPIKKELKHCMIYFDHDKGGISVGSYS